MGRFQTLHTLGKRIAFGVSMKMKPISTELSTFKLSYFGQLSCTVEYRLISVEDVRNYLSFIIYILIFDFFFFSIICQTPTS